MDLFLSSIRRYTSRRPLEFSLIKQVSLRMRSTFQNYTNPTDSGIPYAYMRHVLVGIFLPCEEN